MEHEVFELGEFALQKGSVLPDAKLGYTTLGGLNEARDNVVVCPTCFTATPSDTAAWMTGANRALDPERHFIVVPNHFGAAVSSSPGNTPPPLDGGRFPHVTTYDDVVAQHSLLTEELGGERIRLVSSWSMGASQAPDLREHRGEAVSEGRVATYAHGCSRPTGDATVRPSSVRGRWGNECGHRLIGDRRGAAVPRAFSSSAVIPGPRWG